MSINLHIEYLFLFFHYCFKFSDSGDAQFVKAVFISWEFRWNFCKIFSLLVCLGTCISNFCKHIINARVLRFVDDHLVFISWEFRWKLCKFSLLLVCLGTCISKFLKNSRDMVVHVRVLRLGDYHFIYVVLISWEFRQNLYELFFLLVCIGTCKSNFCKYIRDMFVNGFHIRVMLIVYGFHFRVNVAKVIFC